MPVAPAKAILGKVIFERRILLGRFMIMIILMERMS